MGELFAGIKKFSNREFNKNKKLYNKLSNKQNPHTLFIGCSDSRLVPNLITKTMPGELFMIRNVANLIPPFRQSEEYLSTTSAIEYAVNVLKVNNIVVCGHSNCGGCQALHQENSQELPHINKWLELADPVKAKIPQLSQSNSKKELSKLIEQANIVLQLEHLKSYPYIAKQLKNNNLKIYGWHYNIANGTVYNYNEETKEFELIE
ncbi:carbonic anhydrase [Halanaerobium salsuginis]|jgi:carbonic anhydrase|uniref:Carbonic anhydrase n=1 Tax=Halanaerobium salsuginis TaxID=29563 RepID=A0A1I4MXY8_9FIRM|nr:carbonic anhydrase [Halanaerobium salsuginis]SFM07883.1 carbonic anhydrase [Halanaerobium salsuginis]